MNGCEVVILDTKKFTFPSAEKNGFLLLALV